MNHEELWIRLECVKMALMAGITDPREILRVAVSIRHMIGSEAFDQQRL